ncbi:phospholipid transfer protein C2CD2L isoform X2 [Coregonus clupeaformis]|uniref:phospholipid transfer protein C2CD2L isoform X2 n=1 Tax=Coregonus clupeaformis TaxID=59861 RepID=UPI001BE08AF7|nr:phospholipid transfer protein C2CD2L isoform X2 [Coregonus clupeaformis]
MMMEMLQYISWLCLVGLFLASLLIVLAWLVQYSLAVLRPRSPKSLTQGQGATARLLPPITLSHRIQDGGVWGTLFKLRLGRDGGGAASEAGVKGLLTSLFSFKSFREHWQRAWVKVLNEQACRHGSSIQITFDNSLQLPASAIVDSVTCTDQSASTMVLRCKCAVDTVTFPVTVTQQSPAAVSMDTYQITIKPMLAQLVVRLEEVEEEGLLVSWTFSQQPISLTVAPRRIQREEIDAEIDLDMIRELVKDTLFSTQPAMILNLRACVSSTTFPRGTGLTPTGLTPPSQSLRRLLLRQLRGTCLRAAKSCSSGELCCTMSLDQPLTERRTRFLPATPSPDNLLDWSEDISLDLAPETKELRVRMLEKTTKGEQFLSGFACLPLDLTRRAPTGQHVLSVSPGHGLAPNATVTFELVYLEVVDPLGAHNATPLRTSITPTKKVDVDRTIMPDGTIVTTVTTIQSRPRLGKLGDSPSRSPSKVEVTEKGTMFLTDGCHSRTSSSPTLSKERGAKPKANQHSNSPLRWCGAMTQSTTICHSLPQMCHADSPLSNGLDPVADTAIRQLTENASKVSKKTPTKRSTLIISGVSKVPISEDDYGLSCGYAAAMDAALQGGGASNHYGAGQHQEADETTPSDVSERPSVDDVESETGSTGAMETRSLKDHKVGFLRSGTKLLFRTRHRKKDPTFSQSHEDLSNLTSVSPSSASGPIVRKKSGSFSRRLIKRFSFKSKSKDKASATNGGASTADN